MMGAQPLPYCIQIIQALGPAFVALAAIVITGYFAWKQWSTARDKLRLDLFKERYRYFIAFRDFMILVIQNGSATPSDLSSYRRSMIGFEFMFDKQTVQYINEVTRRIELLVQKNNLRENVEDVASGVKLGDQIAEIFMSINNEFPALEERFSKSMSFAGV